MDSKLKIVTIGGGSSYTPELVEGYINRRNELPVGELWLVDVEAGREKLETIGELAERMVKEAGCDIVIKTTTDRKSALENADFVTTQFRVGGHEARIRDERIPLKYGCIGQETTGAGGFAKAMRTIPVILDICRDMEMLCPDAWMINFTNPSGIIAETILHHTKIKAIGLCNCAIGMQNEFAKRFDCSASDVYCDFVGLNHLLWAFRVLVRNEDLTKHIIATSNEHSEIMKNIPNVSMDSKFLESLGMIPNSYLKYFYIKKEMLEECIKQSENEGVRGEVVRRVEEDLFKLYDDSELKIKPPQLAQRGGAHYSDAACNLINSIYNNKHDIHVVCVRNKGTILDLPEDAVIERNSVIGNSGAQPIGYGHLPLHIRGLVQVVKAYEQLTVRAGVFGDRSAALQALTIHPLVPSISAAIPLLDDLLTANAAYLPQFR
jgi:6-phospho-beta-glucosidase